MRKITFILPFLLLGAAVFAQETTRNAEVRTLDLDLTSIFDSLNYSLMVIPFEPKMYRSDIDRYIGKENGLNFNEVRGYFRLGLDNALMIKSKKNFAAITMHSDDAAINKDLYYIYKSIGYQYEPVPVKEEEEEQSKVQKLVKKLRKPEKPKEEQETKVAEGQVVTRGEYVEKYTKTSIVNPNMLETLTEKYGSDFFLFINQLDLVDAPNTDQRDYGLDNYERLIRVHYTVLDQAGNVITSGRMEEAFSSRTNDIRKIIQNHFTNVAGKVIADLESEAVARLMAENAP